jgi:hypothetical protein
MNLGCFQDFSEIAANAWLSRFLTEESGAMSDYATDLRDDGIAVDFSVESIPAHVIWVAERVRTSKPSADPEIPDWVQESELFEETNFEFDGDSRILLLRFAYYLGESFVRENPALSWAVGAPRTAPQGQPVVKGFDFEMELPVLMVAEVLVARVVRQHSPDGGAGKAIDSWLSKLPSS